MSLQLPSGREYDTADQELVRGLARIGTIKWRDKPFPLRSGIESRVYIDGRGELTANPDILWLVCRKIAQATNHLRRPGLRPCFIGLPTAGTPLAAWASAVDNAENITGYRAVWFVMRETKKLAHGNAKSWVADVPRHDLYHYFVPDNTVTDGGTKLDGNKLFTEDGFKVDQMSHIIMIDRQQGGLKKMATAGVTDVTVLFNLLDMAYALGVMGEWPLERVKAVEQEIEAHNRLAA